MDTTVKVNLADLCRICLVEVATIPIFESYAEDTDVNSKIYLCLGEKIEDKDGYPRNICNKCYLAITDMVALISQYKESCKFLESALDVKNSIKQEFINLNSEPDFLDEQEIPIEFEDLKVEPKIVFNDAIQFEELIKPLVKKIKKEPNEKKKKNGKRKPKKVGAVSRKTGKVASAILEGNFIFNGEQWILGSNQAYTVKTEFKPDMERRRESKNENEKISVEAAKRNCKRKPQCPPIVKKKKVRAQINILCELCGEIFGNRDKLKRHTDRVHTEKNPVSCPICNRMVSNDVGLKRHIARLHAIDMDKKCICSTCGRSFVYQGDLNTHIKMVHLKQIKKKRFPCNICSKDFATTKSLLMHERSAHTGERPAVCEVCGGCFTHEDYLKEHMRLHTGETPYKCPVCARGYAQRCNMKSHIKHVHRLSHLDEISLKTIPQRYLRLMKP